MSRPVSLLPPYAFKACTGATSPLPLPQITIEHHRTEKNLNWKEFSMTTDLVSVTCNHNILLILLWQNVTANLTALFKTRNSRSRRAKLEGEELL
jgi:hypothetical protein